MSARDFLSIFFVLYWLAMLAPSTVHAGCDEFVAMVESAKRQYQASHRIYPVPASLRQLAIQYLPRLWVHPDSWQPIDFADYLGKAAVFSQDDNHLVRAHPDAAYFQQLSFTEQCGLYLHAPEVSPSLPAPVYIQVYRDASPVDDQRQWIYIKYNLVFDWSGLSSDSAWLSHVAVMLSGGDRKHWHRLDIHVSAILAFDEQNRLRLVSLAQHNYQRTYLAGRDFDPRLPIHLAAAAESNELYLDNGNHGPEDHRVVPFFDDIAYLIEGSSRPWLWGMDRSYGRYAGARSVPLKPVFIQPRHPLADFAGYLAPPRRLLGFYIGRDGPPGFNYYAMPSGIPLRKFIALGYWHEGDHRLVEQLTSLIKGWRDTDWEAIVALMQRRLARDLN